MKTPSLRCFLALALFAPTSARAEVLVHGVAGAGLPTGRAEITRFAAGAILGFGLAMPAPHLLGLKLRRTHLDGLSRAMTTVTGFYRWRSTAAARPSLFLGGEAGVGLFTGCIEGGGCNAAGLSFGAEVGVAVPLSARVRVEAAIETVVQLAMPDGAGLLVMPSLVLGVTVR